MPFTQEWLDLEKSLGGRIVLRGSKEEMQATYAKMVEAIMPFVPPPSPNVVSKDGDVDGVKYRIYNLKDQQGELPIGIWAHGGGFTLGDLDSDDLFCRAVCEHSKSVIVQIDYSLAPESKWPTQLDECMKVYRWVHANASSFAGDASKIYTIGGSAGAQLALDIAVQVLKDARLKPSLKGVVAMAPGTCHADTVPEMYKSLAKSSTENAKDRPIIDGESMQTFCELLGPDAMDESFWPLLATDMHKDFPPTYFTSSEFDILRDDSYMLEKALTDAGVPVKHDHYNGLPHYFWIWPQIPESQTYAANLISAIGWLQSQF